MATTTDEERRVYSLSCWWNTERYRVHDTERGGGKNVEERDEYDISLNEERERILISEGQREERERCGNLDKDRFVISNTVLVKEI